MNERQQAELAFWKRDYEKYADRETPYSKIRASNLMRIEKRWPEARFQQGKGLDLGCGPCSIFYHAGLDMYAVDPLMEEYRKFYIPPEPPLGQYDRVIHRLGHKDDGKLMFADNWFDYIFCINVLDHSKYWADLLLEIQRCLKDYGFLFLQVNFDWVLHKPEHVTLWDWTKIQRELVPLMFPVRQTSEYDYDTQQYSYWGKWQKTDSLKSRTDVKARREAREAGEQGGGEQGSKASKEAREQEEAGKQAEKRGPRGKGQRARVRGGARKRGEQESREAGGEGK